MNKISRNQYPFLKTHTSLSKNFAMKILKYYLEKIVCFPLAMVVMVVYYVLCGVAYYKNLS